MRAERSPGTRRCVLGADGVPRPGRGPGGAGPRDGRCDQGWAARRSWAPPAGGLWEYGLQKSGSRADRVNASFPFLHPPLPPHSFHPSSAHTSSWASPQQKVLVAGIEANIPVTYGIGSQRGHESTGCQFIGQSPVHSLLAAC
ncbi:hypothetical protein AB1E18_019329 [Capra hircus]